MVRCINELCPFGKHDKPRTTNNPTGISWELWQLCFGCGIEQHPEHYKSRKQHDHGTGIRKEKPITAQSLFERQSKRLE